jgi:hypothetical protein
LLDNQGFFTPVSVSGIVLGVIPFHSRVPPTRVKGPPRILNRRMPPHIRRFVF